MVLSAQNDGQLLRKYECILSDPTKMILTVSFIISLKINNKISRISSCILTFGWHTLQYEVGKYWRSVLTSALPPRHWHCSLCRYSDCVDIPRYLVQVFGNLETAISCGGLKLCPCWRPQLQPAAGHTATSTLVSPDSGARPAPPCLPPAPSLRTHNIFYNILTAAV